MPKSKSLIGIKNNLEKKNQDLAKRNKQLKTTGHYCASVLSLTSFVRLTMCSACRNVGRSIMRPRKANAFAPTACPDEW